MCIRDSPFILPNKLRYTCINYISFKYEEFRTRNFHRLIQQTWNILKLILCEKFLLQIDFIRKQEEKNVKSNKDSDKDYDYHNTQEEFLHNNDIKSGKHILFIYLLFILKIALSDSVQM